MQELGGEEDEADGSLLEGGAGEQNGTGVFAPLRRPVERRMEKSQLRGCLKIGIA